MTQPMHVKQAHVAGIGRLPKRFTSFGETALRVGAFVAGFIPIPLLGAAAYFGLESLANSKAAHSEKTAVAKWYAPQIAQQLGIDPKRVSASDLELAASVNPAIARVVEKVNQKQASANTTTALASAAGSLVGGSTIAAMAGKMAMGMAGGAVGSWLTSPDVMKDPQLILENIVKERTAGKQISPIETFMLRVSQKSDLQKAIKEATGKEYYNLSPQQHMALMQRFPRIAAFAEKDAVHLNRGGAAQELMFILPEAHWQTRAKLEAARLQTAEPARG